MDLPRIALLDRLPGPFGSPQPPIVLEIDLTRGLQTADPTDPLAALRARNTPLLRDVLAGLRRGAQDGDVAGVVVHVSDAVTIAQAEELGAAITGFCAVGKATIAWSETFGELSPGTVAYYLASRAQTIWMQPSGAVGLTGITLQMSTVRGTLDKIGAQPQIGQRHEYKTAAEQFMSTEITAPNREMTQRIADSVLEQVSASVQRHRGLSADQVDRAVSASPLSGDQALEHGLVDRLGYRDDVYADLYEELGSEGEVRLQYAHRYARHVASRPKEQLKRRSQPVVAVVPVHGGIVTGRGAGSPLGGPSSGSETVCAALRLAAADDDVKAVVLKVDSPGGSYVASDAIRDAIGKVKATGRPVVAAMGQVAASGGYFVSMPADHIVALPTTLTGSIGVLGGKVVLAETFARLGVQRESVGAGRHATMFATTAAFDDTEWVRVNEWLDTVYDDFTAKGAADRGIDLEDFEPLARGRVWTGADARERGLVDQLGGLETAVVAACERAGLDRARTNVVAVPHLSLLERLVRADSSQDASDAVRSGPAPGLLAAVTQALGLPLDGVLTMPYALRIT